MTQKEQLREEAAQNSHKTSKIEQPSEYKIHLPAIERLQIAIYEESYLAEQAIASFRSQSSSEVRWADTCLSPVERGNARDLADKLNSAQRNIKRLLSLIAVTEKELIEDREEAKKRADELKRQELAREIREEKQADAQGRRERAEARSEEQGRRIEAGEPLLNGANVS